MTTAANTASPAVAISSLDPETTAMTMRAIATTASHGRAGATRSTSRSRNTETAMPATTGTSTTKRMVVAMSAKDTGSDSPASHSASAGVTTGASSVEIDVIVTESATSPRAK